MNAAVMAFLHTKHKTNRPANQPGTVSLAFLPLSFPRLCFLSPHRAKGTFVRLSPRAAWPRACVTAPCVDTTDHVFGWESSHSKGPERDKHRPRVQGRPTEVGAWRGGLEAWGSRREETKTCLNDARAEDN